MTPNTARCWRCHALVPPGTVHEHEGLTFTAIPSVERGIPMKTVASLMLQTLFMEPDP